ncbi:PREDICTED: uncharacterized protein LOC104783385 [Camelina sativa]|uniref:Uncharacterized protein LOC104722122 n=1 Tax=Camelina sativa TaxID=90675 RepID=A0ABM0YWE0_CAMSA|nr:PREDICTED: uncharacterized protein LOC104722122 [Camelina sativa]XP_010506844.1 PREDICTED: uncharacterized protein LOC104783385 [Camelina sativa]
MNYNITTKNVLDVSAFLLLEASADSEAGHGGVDDDKCVKDIDDDDESCSASCSCEMSCITWTSHTPDRQLEFAVEDTVKEETDAAEEEEEEEEEEEDGEGEVNSYIRSCGRSQRENLAVAISEMDQNRMFWEACLAS